MTTQCKFEDCAEPTVAGGENLCERHADDLRRSRAFWTPGRMTLDPMPANEAQLWLGRVPGVSR